jgi:4-amino-4-deoxy-L-arabinose transferase-like glycosyltransferase
MAGGFLTKWTAPEFFYGTALPLLWWRGKLRWLRSWQHLVSLAVAITVCVAWIAAAVWLEGWNVWWATVEREAFSRLVPSYDPKPYPWLETLFHPLKLLAATLPWSVFALFTLRASFFKLWDERGQRLLQALHCWAWPHVLFWSLPTEHTPRHSFPLFPAIAGLAALVWLAWFEGKLDPWQIARSCWQASCQWGRRRAGLDRRDAGPTGLGLGNSRVAAVRWLAGCLVLWLVAKVVFVEAVMPGRNANRQPRAKAALIASLVPLDRILYLFRLKDEGIMFYYGRIVRRLHAPEQLPTNETAYCILTRREYENWQGERSAELIQRLSDEQGDPLVLVRVLP